LHFFLAKINLFFISALVIPSDDELSESENKWHLLSRFQFSKDESADDTPEKQCWGLTQLEEMLPEDEGQILGELFISGAPSEAVSPWPLPTVNI
jgi:hypothetical protein